MLGILVFGMGLATAAFADDAKEQPQRNAGRHWGLSIWGLSYHTNRSIDYDESNWGLGVRYYARPQWKWLGRNQDTRLFLEGDALRNSNGGIVLPLSANGLAAVWLVMFILMFGDVALAVLVAPPGESTLAVRAYTLMANSPVPDVARIALVQIVLSVLPLAALVLVIRRLDAR